MNKLIHTLTLIFFFLISNYIYGINNYKLVKPISENESNYSGDKQHGKINSILTKPVRFQVLKNDSIPIPYFPINISTISTPQNSQGFNYSKNIAYTGIDGIAEIQITLGDKEGEYEIIASIESRNKENFVVNKFFARDTKWIMFMTFGLLGGLALFLYGMQMLSNGLQKSAGDKMRSILSRLTHNNFIALGVGAITTTIVQSSSATSVMLVSFVNSGLMRFRQTLAIILGAAIGATITAQIIAFKITGYSIVMIGIGAFAYLFANTNKIKNVGETILGFGLLFFGMEIMSEAMYPLRSYDPFISLLMTLENPIIGLLVGAIFTAIIQSSSAFIGIMIILATQNLLTIESSMALLLGANLGTPVTAILSSIKTNIEAKKVAYAMLGYKIFLTLVFIGIIPYTISLLKLLIPLDQSSEYLPRYIANAHTFYNFALAFMAFPFIKPYSKLISRLFPNNEKQREIGTIKYLDNSALSSPSIAISLAKQETIRLGSKIIRTLDLILTPFLNNDPKSLENIIKRRVEIKLIRDSIREYLLKIDRASTTNKTLKEEFQIVHTVNELSHINDELTKILHRRAEKWIARNYEFSEEGRKEIKSYHLHTKNTLRNALSVFKNMNLENAEKVKINKHRLAVLAKEYEKLHFMRQLSHNSTDIANAKTYVELIHTFNQIINLSESIVKLYIETDDSTEYNI